MQVTFVIPVRDDAKRLKACLASIARNECSPERVEVIVADNGSRDDSAQVAAAAGARVMSLPDLRVAELRNRAASAATGDVLAFVDADHEIAPTWVASAIDALAGDDVGAAGALCTAPPNGTWVQRMYGGLRGRTTGRGEVSWLGSGNLAARRSAFQAVGGFDARLEACEDVDLCQRLHSSGWKIIGDARLENIHLGDPATLGALFRAERWRGRDNLRVTLRGRLTWRDLPSLLIPMADVAAAVLVLAGLAALPFLGVTALGLVAAAVLVTAGLSSLRAVRIISNLGSRRPGDLGQAFLVALTYDLARALGLIWRAPHHRRS